jgi:hypothetical protein
MSCVSMFTVPANVISYSNIRGVYGERVQNYAWIRSRSMFLLWENPDLLYAAPARAAYAAF